MKLADSAEKLLDFAKKAGADGADCVLSHGDAISISIRNSKLEDIERAEGVDVSLRVFTGARQACISSSNSSDETLQTLAERAVAMAREALDDPYAEITPSDRLATELPELDLEDTSKLSPEDMIEFAKEMEEAAASKPDITQVESSSDSISATERFLASSNGFASGYKTSSRSLGISAIAGSGLDMEKDYDFSSARFTTDLRKPADIGKRAAERTLERASPKPAKTGSFPVFYDQRISSSLIQHLLGLINGASLTRGTSWLKNDMGNQVLPEGIDLIDDPHRLRGMGSRPFDGEGYATGSKKLIEDGVLQSWILDNASANQLGLKPTASASLPAGSPPRPSASNAYFSGGSEQRENLIKSIKDGLVITRMMGSSINPNTGDYSRGASGFWVENGEISHAVNEVTIAGNLREMLLNMVLADDLKFESRLEAPSILIPKMSVAGSS